jgi:hypothetical protein
MLYIILRGPWYHISVLNVHIPAEDKTDDVKDSFYEELLGDFNAKVGKEDIFKPAVSNGSLHEISNDNGIGVTSSVV